MAEKKELAVTEEKVVEIEMERLRSFENHPFKVKADSQMIELQESIIEDKHDNLVGRFSCKGFDTFGPFKLIGGVAKGHPDDRDLAAAVEFYKKLIAGGVVNE